MQLIRIIGLILLIPLSAGTGGAYNGPTAQVMQKAASSVVQIIARDCLDQNKTGSGFVWEDNSHVVTAFHVVGGCSKIVAYIQGRGEIVGEIVRVLSRADLALVKLKVAAPVGPLKAAMAVPNINENLQVIGFYYGVPTLDSRTLTVTLGSSTLNDMLTDQARNSLQQASGIDLGIDILRLDGNLVPGLSGAPLINQQGEVVGIGSGGLENGLAGISWAVRAHYLDELAQAPAPTSAETSESASNLFSAPLEGSSPSQLPCGDFNFVRTKKRTLRELLNTTDDITGFMQLASTAQFDVKQLESIEYTVYSEQNSGASVAVPSGASLTSQQGECQVAFQDSVFIRVGSRHVATPLDVQAASVDFEQKFDYRGQTWFANPAFSYLQPTQRADGLIVRRKAAVGYSGQLIHGLAFETLLSKGDIFVGVQATNSGIDPQTWSYCPYQPADAPTCARYHQVYNFWAATLLGVHLSTIPPT
jgi:hypothetical protein